MGGVLDVHTRDVPCKVYGDTIPNKIRVNLQDLPLGTRIRINEVEVYLFVCLFDCSSCLPASVPAVDQLLSQLPPEIVPKQPDLFLAKIVGRQTDLDDEEEM